MTSFAPAEEGPPSTPGPACVTIGLSAPERFLDGRKFRVGHVLKEVQKLQTIGLAVEGLMTPDQVAEAQRLAREWTPK